MSKVIKSFPFCQDNGKYAGAVEVVEIALGQRGRTIGVQIRVSNKTVFVHRHRIQEIVNALKSAETEASHQYKLVLQELNQ